MRRIVLAGAMVALAVALVAPTTAGAEPFEIGTDDPGDWGAEVDPTLGALGHEIGADLTSASLDFDAASGIVKFIIGVSNLPENGGTPEGIRYIWAMSVNGEFRELDGKFTNYSRGSCDPTAGTCPPPRDPGLAPFLLRGNCVSTGQVTTCTEFARVQATFDVANNQIIVPIPIDALGEGCITIEPGSNSSFPSSNITTVTSAFFSNSLMPNDQMSVDGVGNFNCATD